MPFFFVAAELYAYLMEFILDNQDGEEIMKNTSADIVYDLAFLSNTRLLIIEDYELLKHYYFTPRGCLHIAEKYLDARSLKAIWDLTTSGQWPEVQKLPEFKKLTRALKRWELKHMPATRH